MDVLTDVWVDKVIKVLVGVFVMAVRDGVVIGTLSGVQVDVIMDVVFDIGVEVLTDANVNILGVAMAALWFVMSAPFEESASFC